MGNCADVCIDMYWDGNSEFCVTKECASRKERKCCECHAVIPIGAKYSRSTGKSDGDFWSTATCLLCVEIRKAFVCGSFVFEELWQSIEDELFPRWRKVGPWDCLAKLDTDAARAMMNARYNAWEQERIADGY